MTLLFTTQVRAVKGVGADGESAEDKLEAAASQAAESGTQSAAAAKAAAMDKVVRKLEQKNLMENVVPSLVSLYRLLQQERSPLLKQVLLKSRRRTHFIFPQQVFDGLH